MKYLVRSMAVGLLCLAVGIPAGAQPGKSIVQYGLRLETHSDKNSPDDYLMTLLSVTRSLDQRVVGNVFYLFRENLDTGNEGGHAAGFNLSRAVTGKSMVFTGYMFNQQEPTSTRTFRITRDRFRFGWNYLLRECADGNRITAGLTYNTQTDWSETRTLDAGVSLRRPLSDRWTADAGYKYTYAYGLNLHVYNQWNLSFSWKWAPDTRVDVGFLLVEKTYSGLTAALQPDDDLMMRLGVTRWRK